MKLVKRNDGGPVEPEEDVTPTGKKPVVVYIMVLFIAAFLLMAWSFASHQRSNTEAIGELQSSVTAMRGVQDRVVNLEKQLGAAQNKIQDLERQAQLREYELEASSRHSRALEVLYALERLYRQESLENCRSVIDMMEQEDLVSCLSDQLSDSEQSLGLTVSAQERYQQLKEAVEALEAEAAQAEAGNQEEAA